MIVTGLAPLMSEPRKRHRGLGEIYSTVVVRSGYPGELLAFSNGIGGPLPGSSNYRPTCRGETNMHVANQFVDEDAEAIGIEWVIPAVVGKEYLDNAASEAYCTRLLDVIEFARCAFIRVYFDGGKPYAEWTAIHKPIVWGSEGARQQIRFRDAVQIGKLMKFWVSIEFPGAAPKFGKLPRSDGSFGEGLEAVLPVAFRFMEAADVPPALSLKPVADVLLQAASVQQQAEQLFARIEKLVNPNPTEDAELAAEVRELQKCFGSTADLIDVLRAVRQGIRTR